MVKINKFIDQVKAEQAEIIEAMTNGNFVNFESYQRYVGRYQGLENALEILEFILKDEDTDVV